MSLAEYADVVRERWFLATAVAAGIVAAVVGWTALTVPLYSAAAGVRLAVEVVDEPRFLGSGDQYAGELTRSCIVLATRPVVVLAAVRRAGVDVAPDVLAEATTARARRDSSYIEIRVTDPSPTRAAALADAVAVELAPVCNTLRPSSEASLQVFAFAPVSVAAVPVNDDSPKWGLNLGLAGVVGVIAGVVAAIAADDRRPRVGAARRREGRIPVLGTLTARSSRGRPRLQARVDAFLRERDPASVLLVVEPAGERGERSVRALESMVRASAQDAAHPRARPIATTAARAARDTWPDVLSAAPASDAVLLVYGSEAPAADLERDLHMLTMVGAVVGVVVVD
jgi:capsular polysaccharide biosynthesis protein